MVFDDHERFHLGVFGGSGTGKTTYGLKFVTSAAASCVFVFDPEGVLSRMLGIRPARTYYELDQAVRTGWVVIDPHILYPGDMEEAVNYFAHFTLKVSPRLPGRKFFVVDELQWYVTGSVVPRYLKVLVQSGRRVGGIDGVFMASQPNELHNTVRSQLTEVVCFQMTDDNALEFPKKFGFDVEAVRRLGKHRYICRNNRGDQFTNCPAPQPAAG